MLSYKESLKILKETNALLEGHFILSSGLHSKQYIQCAKLLSHPQKAEIICSSLAEKIKKKFNRIDIVLSPAMGGVLVGYEIGRQLKVETIFAERADGLFDELWDSTKTKFQNTNVRTAKVINWYCSCNGVGNNILFGCYLNNKLLGYMLCMSETENNILKKLTVMDIWGQIDRNRVVCSLLN